MSETAELPTAEHELTEEEILSSYLPSADPITIDLPVRGKMTFAPLGGSKGKKKLSKTIEAFVSNLPNPGDPGFTLHPLKDFLPMDEEELLVSLEIHFRSIRPKISQRGALAMHENPDLIAYLRKQLDIADKKMLALYYQSKADEATGKSQTPGNEGASSLAAELSQGETPTT